MLGVVDVATGQLAGDYRYDAFEARTATGEAIRYGFTGREHDASGLIYYRARHFDPQTGRFLQPDPIGFAAGDLNIYAYVWNDQWAHGFISELRAAASVKPQHSMALVRTVRFGPGMLRTATITRDFANSAIANSCRSGRRMLPPQRMTAFTNSPNPAGCPAGPEGETPFLSERDLVVAVDQLGVLALVRLRAA